MALYLDGHDFIHILSPKKGFLIAVSIVSCVSIRSYDMVPAAVLYATQKEKFALCSSTYFFSLLEYMYMVPQLISTHVLAGCSLHSHNTG